MQAPRPVLPRWGYSGGMSLSVAFVREMKSGSREITNAELRAVFDKASFTVVTTFRSSGNIVFVDNGPEDRRLPRLRKALKGAFGGSVPIFLRTSQQLRKLAGQTPFSAEQIRTAKGKLRVTILPSAPTAKIAAAVVHIAPEARTWIGRDLYWLPSSERGAVAELAAIEAKAGVCATRTMGTLQSILKKLK